MENPFPIKACFPLAHPSFIPSFSKFLLTPVQLTKCDQNFFQIGESKPDGTPYIMLKTKIEFNFLRKMLNSLKQTLALNLAVPILILAKLSRMKKIGHF